MTFAEFKAAVINEAFPLGPPDNLTLDSYVVSGMIEAQRWIKCLRYRHDDVIPACRTYWHCGATVLTAPRGKILRVYTVERGEGGVDWCHPVILTPVPLPELRRWQAKFRGRWEASFYRGNIPVPASGRNLPLGFDVPTASSDSVSGRALAGVYAFDPAACRLYLAPWLQTTESVVIEWQGIKRAWQDSDLVPDDPDYLRLLRTFVDREYGRKWSAGDLSIREGAWAEALSDLMVTCEEESRLHGEPASPEEVDNAAFSPYVAPAPAVAEEASEEVRITFVGDFGDGGADAQSVAAAVKADNPDGWVISLGDNKYPPTSAETSMGLYGDYVVASRFRAALGDNDLNDGALGADVSSYAGNPGNGRYFVQRVGPVAIFVINGGLKSDRTSAEPTGNFPGSRQWQEVSAAILRDTSPWKIAVVHQPPFSSGSITYPGEGLLRWVTDLPVHAVLSGHSRNYERLEVRGRLHLVAGVGGLPLEPFGSVYPGSQERQAEFGFVRLTATCTAAKLEYVSREGDVLDEAVLSGALASVTALPDLRITDQPVSVGIDGGQPLELALEAAGTAPITYQWFRNGVSIEGATDPTYSKAMAYSIDAGIYHCVVSNPAGAVVSAAVTVTITGDVQPYLNDKQYFVDSAELRESDTAQQMVAVNDDNGDPVWFVRGTADANDGVEGIQRADGVWYRRFR